MWSSSLKLVYIIELTVPWEGAVEEAYERKKLRYADLAADAQQQGWNAKVGCRGFIATSTSRLLRDMGVRGKAHRQAVKDLSKAAEKGSQWLWTRRKDPTWGSKCVMADGSEPGTLGFTAEPSGGVVGLSAKHPRKRSPT